MRIETIPAEATHALRARVLRDGDASAVAFAEDDRPGAFHLGARDGAGRIVGVASFSPEETPWRPGRAAWRLRGMAVATERQGTGVGRALLRAALDELRDRGAEVLWANARDRALGFYENLGMKVEGEGFLVRDLPHHVVVLELGG